MKRFQILAVYNISGKECECLCYDAGCAITLDEETAQKRVDALHQMGIATARYEELPQDTAWFDDKNWMA